MKGVGVASGRSWREDPSEEVINALPTGKSPGPETASPPRPILQNRWSKAEIVNILTRVINESKDIGSLPDSCREGLISVLHKKGTREDPRMYRPITLLNCDYKILYPHTGPHATNVRSGTAIRLAVPERLRTRRLHRRKPNAPLPNQSLRGGRRRRRVLPFPK